MAFDSLPNGPASRRSPHPSPPEAPRPRPDIWNALRADGIQWEGQVLLAGAGLEIPALLVLTSTRFVLLSQGEIALEVPRLWLRPEPRLLEGKGVRISITPQGGGAADETDRLNLKVREGRPAAARLVSAISGRLVSPREERGIARSDPPTKWTGSVGAASPIALPPLPDFDSELPPTAARSWPPIEQHAVPSTPPPKQAAGTASTWPATPRETAKPATHALGGDHDAVEPLVIEDRREFNRGLVWGLRALILALLVGAGLYFGRDSLPAHLNLTLPAAVETRFGLDDETPTPDVSQLPAGNQQTGSQGEVPAEPTKATSDGTNGPPNSDAIATESSVDGLGGDNGSEITPVNPGIGEYPESTQEPPVEDTTTDDPGNTGDVPTTEPEPLPTDEPIMPTDEPVIVPTDEPIVPTTEPVVEEPTQEPVTEEPATEAPVTEEPPTEAPVTEEPATEAPATEAPATDPPVTEAPATEAPVTEEPATEAPATEAPVTEEPVTEEPATEAPATEAPVTEEPATEAPATLESQPPSVDPASPPEQALASGGFRYAIAGASRGETIADLPDLAATGTGEWVVLSMTGQNASDTEQVFDMSQFQLYADGKEVQLDVGNAWVSGLLGFTPAYGNTDAILWAADEGHPFALTFLVPTGAQQLTLVAGDQAIDLGSALANQAPLAQDTTEASKPEYIEATVVDVIDAETIVIEKDGIQQTVRYLGIDVPTGDDCYASEAAEANRRLVEGKTVRLERQATDVDAQGNWVRDVWTPAEDGRYFLVSESLVSDGAATAGISEPNTRYAGWLLGSQSVAKAEERGLWGSCGEEDNAQVSTELEAILPATARVTNYRRAHR